MSCTRVKRVIVSVLMLRDKAFGRAVGYVGLVTHGLDLLHVIGSRNSSNATRLVDVARAGGVAAYLIDDATEIDEARYQTVYAREEGSVAAPTAGLHFDESLLQRIREMGVDAAHVTLHVGSGTFQPVRVENVLEHRMHSERIVVTEAVPLAEVYGYRPGWGRPSASPPPPPPAHSSS